MEESPQAPLWAETTLGVFDPDYCKEHPRSNTRHRDTLDWYPRDSLSYTNKQHHTNFSRKRNGWAHYNPNWYTSPPLLLEQYRNSSIPNNNLNSPGDMAANNSLGPSKETFRKIGCGQS